MKIKTKIIWAVAFSFWVGMFTFVGWKNLDPDFGWHIRVGEYITRQGIPKTDPFSYTMPSYPFIDHEWLTNVLMNRILEWKGYGAEAFIFGLLAGIFLWILVFGKKPEYVVIPVIMGASVWLSRGGVRPQVLDWIFLAGMLRLVWEEQVWKKWRWTVIPMFGLWANLHGGFAIGPAVLGVILVLKGWEKRRIDKQDVFVWCGGILATGINPYGPGLWHEVWMQMTDSHLRWNVVEWQPFWVKTELGIWLMAALAAAVWRVSEAKLEIWKLGVTGCFFLAGLSSLRHQSLLAVMLILVIAEMTEKLAGKFKKNRLMWDRARKFYLLVLVISGVVFAGEAGVMLWRTAGGKGGISYPTRAIEVLRERKFSGEVFSEYAWGGYLLWKFPEKKVFMDGRMPSWRWEGPGEESDWAFKDYIWIRDKGEFREEFAKYDIRVVLWPRYGLTGEIPSKNLGWWAKIMRWGLKEERKDLIEILQESGWTKEYEDETTVIYVSPEPI